MPTLHHTPPTLAQCRCGRKLNPGISIGEFSMRPGDTAICTGCGRISIWDESLNLRMPTINDFKDMPKNMHLAIQSIRHQIRTRNIARVEASVIDTPGVDELMRTYWDERADEADRELFDQRNDGDRFE